MTEYMIDFLSKPARSRGLIFIQDFDLDVESFLCKYEVIWRTHNQILVKDNSIDKEFLVIKAGKQIPRGRRANHIIIDKRIDDEIVDLILSCLSGITRKVELF